jgi:hypothetical protein
MLARRFRQLKRPFLTPARAGSQQHHDGAGKAGFHSSALLIVPPDNDNRNAAWILAADDPSYAHFLLSV